MDFDKLTKIEKIKYWKDVESDIRECILRCDDLIPNEICNEIKVFLTHNELGIALECLTEVIIEKEIKICGETKEYILNTFVKMNYHNDEKDRFYTYGEYLGDI